MANSIHITRRVALGLVGDSFIAQALLPVQATSSPAPAMLLFDPRQLGPGRLLQDARDSGVATMAIAGDMAGVWHVLHGNASVQQVFGVTTAAALFSLHQLARRFDLRLVHVSAIDPAVAPRWKSLQRFGGRTATRVLPPLPRGADSRLYAWAMNRRVVESAHGAS